MRGEPSQFTLYANQTAHSGGPHEAANFGRATSYERKLSGVSASVGTATMHGTSFANARMNLVGAPASQEKAPQHKDLVTRSSRLTRVSEQRTQKSVQGREQMLLRDQVGASHAADQTGLHASSASQRTTPALGVNGAIREVKIRKGRNLRQIRPGGTNEQRASLGASG